MNMMKFGVKSKSLLILVFLTIACQASALYGPKERAAFLPSAHSTSELQHAFFPDPATLTSESSSSKQQQITTESFNTLSPTPLQQDEYRAALVKTALTVAAASLFGVFLTLTRGKSTGYEFFASYLVEQSLSIDNLFVFIMLFDYFQVPLHLQNRVLSWGIAGAVVLRGIMIMAGVAVLQRFKSVLLVFAGILLASSFKLLTEATAHQEGDGDSENNFVMKITSSLFPNTSHEFHGQDFFVLKNGKRMVTPLFLCLVCVELSDFVFAVDSIPAVLGVTQDPLVVYASNIFAIMALRSLYTVVAKAVTDLTYLKPAVALVLGFVGSKMIAEYFHVHIGTDVSLGVICSLLGGGVLLSVWGKQRRAERSPFVQSEVTIF